ncbi:glycosyltransferase [Candidatus Marinarcus aquaticus]|uniref:Uncharacterized protein n=1 Tax=Candidatus Marinarcus aquaticus TaxID=2044504 RepID=A0A4Q0XNB6_9BACT|nr:glycosyltransferase [Candidatus Marinarcus aquaticus]RXJ55395.1 hypothetical protein CRV04_09830 [Candidatus Marinarcus aquaticus]
MGYSVKPKILFIVDTLAFGGAQKVLFEQMKYIKKQGYEVALFSIKKNMYHNWFEEFLIYGAINEQQSIATNIFVVLEKLKEVVPHFDVIIGFIDLFTNYLAVMSGKMHNKTTLVSSRVVLSDHLQKIDYPSVNHEMITYFYNQADGVIALSKNVKKDLIEKYAIDTKKIFQVYNPVNFKRVEQLSQKDCKHETFFNRRVILSIGRMTEQKNHLFVLELFSHIADEYEDVNLCILGDGPLRESLLKKINKLSLENRVLLPGNVENIYPYLEKSELFLFPSLYEGLGNSILEALSVGVPIVASNLEVIKELIENKKNGLLCELAQPETFIQAIKKILEDKSYAQILSNNGKISVQRFQISKIGEEFLRVINKVYNG